MLQEKQKLTPDYSGAIYISHAYGGKEENITEVEKIVRLLRKVYPKALFVSPIHCFGFLYNETEYQEGLDMTLWLLSRCNAMIAVGEISKGVRAELDFCQRRHIPYVHVDDVGELLPREENVKMITLYTINCPNCKILEERLRLRGIKFEICSDVDKMLSMGMSTMPVLEVDNTFMNFQQAFAWVENQKGTENEIK